MSVNWLIKTISNLFVHHFTNANLGINNEDVQYIVDLHVALLRGIGTNVTPHGNGWKKKVLNVSSFLNTHYQSTCIPYTIIRYIISCNDLLLSFELLVKLIYNNLYSFINHSVRYLTLIYICNFFLTFSWQMSSLSTFRPS